MIPKFHLITINQIMIKILKTTKSLIFPVPCNDRLTVRARRLGGDATLKIITSPRMRIV